MKNIYQPAFHRSYKYYETIQRSKFKVSCWREKERDLRSRLLLSLSLFISFLILFNSRSSSARRNSLRKHNKISVEKTAGGAQDAEWNFLVSSETEALEVSPYYMVSSFYALFSLCSKARKSFVDFANLFSLTQFL